ncbi:MAG: TonB-dependent receptor [Cyclobacteriaceae bacterium]
MSKSAIYALIICQSIVMAVANNLDAQRKQFSELEINLPEYQGDVKLTTLIKDIEEVSEFEFAYPQSLVRGKELLIQGGSWNMEDLLKKVSASSKISIKRVNEVISLTEASVNSSLPKISEQIFIQQTVSGTVTDENGEYLPGATIMEKGANNGTVSDINGNFSLEVNEGAVLVVSFVGYTPSEIVVNSRSQIIISLEPDVESLEEVVVIGYGEVRKRDLTGAISSVKVEENVSRQYNSVDMMLQGRAAGVQVSSNAGNPGQSISVNIRGTSTLSGKSQPLYVIDGVIVNSASEEVLKTVDDGNEYQAPQNGLSGLNPQDIESMEVLKDASATAIYGSRGANGVVLITTKKGKAGAAKINVYSTIDFSVISKTLGVMDPVTYAEFRLEQSDLTNSAPDYSIQGTDVYRISYDTGEPVTSYNPIKQISWQDELYKMGVSYNEGITISGAADKTNYYFSANYRDQNGLVDNSNLRNGNLRLNLNRELNSKLELDTRLSLNYTDLNFAHTGNKSGSNRSFTSQVLRYRPLLTTDESIDIENELSNPYAWVNDFDDITEEIRLQAVNKLSYKMTEALKYSFLIGLDYRNKERSRWYGTNTYRGNLQNGNLGISSLTRYSYTMNHLLTYSKKFGKNHRVNSTLGFTYDAGNSKYGNYEVADFPVQTLRTESPQAGQNVLRPLSFRYVDQSIQSVLFRGNYNFQDRYLVTASFRADGSSKFVGGNKWGFFPAVAFAWRLSEETFLKDHFFDDLKLRTGWGQTGNQSINAYSTLSQYGPSTTSNYVDTNNGILVGNVVSGIANPDLKWESTTQFNVGLDIGLLESRLVANVDLYSKHTKDLLQQLEIGPSNGFTTMPVNLGEISNKGLELSLSYITFDKDDINITIGGNIAFNRNRIEKLGLAPATVWHNGKESEEIYYLGEIISTGSLQQPANIFMEGQPIGMFWGYKTAGIYQTEDAAVEGPTFNGTDNVAGDVIFVDQNGDGNIDGNDRTFIGNPNPDFSYGFNISVTYKRFNLSALFNGVYGNDVANATLSQIGYATLTSSNALKDAYINAWRPEAPSNSNPRIGWNYADSQFTDRLIEDGSYLRLNNLSIGYDLPIEKIKGISKVNIYVSANNLFTITKYTGYDPVATSYMFEGGIMGVDWLGTPNVRNYLMGINLSF